MSESDERTIRQKSQPDPTYRRRCIITFLYQTMPWTIFITIFLIDLIVGVFIKDTSESTQRYFVYAYLAGFGAVLIILSIGAILCYKNAQGKFNFVLMIVFYLVFIGFSITLIFSLSVQGQNIITLCLGVPFITLSLGHFLWVLLCKESPTNNVASGGLVLLSSVTPAICIIIKYHKYMGFAAFVAVPISLMQVLVNSSWMSAVKNSLNIE